MIGQIIAQGQRAAASAQRVQAVLATDPVIVDRRRPVPRCRADAAGEVRFEDVSFGYQGGRDVPVLDDLDLTIEAGRVGRAGGRHRQRQVDRRPTAAPLLRRRRRPHPPRRRRRARPAPAPTCAGPSGIVFEDTFLFSDTIADNIAFADPDADDDADRAGGPPGRRPRVHRGAARRLPHRDRRARLLAVGRPAPAHRHRPGHPRRPPGADPRRRHLVGRPHQGARDPRRADRGHARPHHHRHRPPARPPSPWPTGWCCSTTAGSSPRAPTSELLATDAAYREVLAAAERSEAHGLDEAHDEVVADVG